MLTNQKHAQANTTRDQCYMFLLVGCLLYLLTLSQCKHQVRSRLHIGSRPHAPLELATSLSLPRLLALHRPGIAPEVVTCNNDIICHKCRSQAKRRPLAGWTQLCGATGYDGKAHLRATVLLGQGRGSQGRAQCPAEQLRLDLHTKPDSEQLRARQDRNRPVMVTRRARYARQSMQGRCVATRAYRRARRP